MSVKIQHDSPKGTAQRKEETKGRGATTRHKLHVSDEGRLVFAATQQCETKFVSICSVMKAKNPQ